MTQETNSTVTDVYKLGWQEHSSYLKILHKVMHRNTEYLIILHQWVDLSIEYEDMLFYCSK